MPIWVGNTLIVIGPWIDPARRYSYLYTLSLEWAGRTVPNKKTDDILDAARFRQTGGSPHRYILPRIELGPERSCGVRVEIMTTPTRNEETSSWSAITSVGSLLIQACRVPGSGYIGGWAFAGDDEYIKVTIIDWRFLHSIKLGESPTSSSTNIALAWAMIS